MDTQSTGAFIARLRREKNLTQGELGALLGVTDKAVSKWETGRGMPDVSLLIPLGVALEVSVNELLYGNFVDKKEVLTVSDKNLIHVMNRLERVKKNRHIYIGACIGGIGLILQLIGRIDWTSVFGQFLQGVFIGLSTGMMVLGLLFIVVGVARGQANRKERE